MDLLFALLFCFTLLLASVIKGIHIAYPLLCTLGVISAVLMRQGFSAQLLLKMAWRGSQKAFPVFAILLLIGAVTSTWMAAGTVPVIVYFGIQLINPHWFILASFILTSFVSLLLGTSFGAVGTIGLALMIMAEGSGVDSHLIAGAVIAGAYFGDRCSPMSSSAHLIATITRTNLYINLKNMVRTGMLPFAVACLLYFGFSLLYPVSASQGWLTTELARLFNLNGIVLLPALIVLTLAILRVEVKRSMLISIVAAANLAIFCQHYSLWQVLQFAFFGFHLNADTPVQFILRDGGMWTMARVCGVVLISTAIAGILAGTNSLQWSEQLLKQVRSRASLFFSTTLIGTIAVAFGCSQTIGILLTEQLVKQKYAALTDNYQLALDLENTVVVLAPLIPWNIAGLVPATILMTDAGFIPYALYLYLIPGLTLLQLYLNRAGGRRQKAEEKRKTCKG